MAGRAAFRVGFRTLLGRTCDTCFEFKPGEAFPFDQMGYRSSRCGKCHGQESSIRFGIQNAEALQNATNHFNIWTGQDIRTLQKCLDEGLTQPQIAKVLHRSLSSIRNYIHKNKMKANKKYTATPGMPIDIDFIRDYIKEAS